jgi:glycosyltransferase involved in cell wall biosynthesis
LQKNIKLVGEKSGVDLIKLYKSSQIFILPSIYEGQPLTLIEAWASKLPVIVTKSGDCQYLVKDGFNGYLIKNPNDKGEIAHIIEKAISTKNLNKLGQNGYNFVKSTFSWEKSAQQTLELYESLA